MSETNIAINEIYRERERFIIIGLTGRTGSGCTTVANILNSSKFTNLALKQPKETGFTNCDERKYRIIYSYAKSHWKPYSIIQMSDIIASFVFQQGYVKIKKYITENINFSNEEKLNEIIGDELIKKIDNISDLINKQLSDGTNSLSRKDNDFGKSQCELLKNITEIKRSFKDALEKINYTYPNKSNGQEVEDVYTHLFQNWGNNIRSSGDPFCDNFTGTHMFDVARRANDFIKAIRKVSDKEDARICIDALRNPFEATYFKDRYAAFYLVSVNVEENDRKIRLSYLPKKAIKKLDSIESPDNPKDKRFFFEQNIAACLQLADIHLYNPEQKINEKFFLTEQVVKYTMLILHPGLVTPTHIERCMQIAYNAKVNSGCLSRQVGAVVTDENFSVKSIGWNDVPQGQVPCSLRDVRAYCINKDKNSHSQFELEDKGFNTHMFEQYSSIDYNKLNGRLHPYCFKNYYNSITKDKNQVHTRALHAEENAFLQIAKYGGVGIKGGYLFVTASPCELCSKKAYQLGIKKIFYIDPYPGISLSHILSFGYSNPFNPEMILFYGAIGHAYTNLYSQRIPLKDELKFLLG